MVYGAKCSGGEFSGQSAKVKYTGGRVQGTVVQLFRVQWVGCSMQWCRVQIAVVQSAVHRVQYAPVVQGVRCSMHQLCRVQWCSA